MSVVALRKLSPKQEVKEHQWQIPMPWKSRVYAINWDERRIGRRVLFIAWRFEHGCFFLRAGWIYRW